jgi:hypothetical protein
MAFFPLVMLDRMFTEECEIGNHLHRFESTSERCLARHPVQTHTQTDGTSFSLEQAIDQCSNSHE